MVVLRSLLVGCKAVVALAAVAVAVLSATILSSCVNAAEISTTLISKTGSDASSGVSSAHDYTLALDLATNSSLTLNGVQFTPTGGSGTSAFPWVVADPNYGGTLTQTLDDDSTGLSTLSNGSIQADGTIGQIIDTFSYQQTSSVGGSRIFEFGGLTAGTRYRANFYGFDWDDSLNVRIVDVKTEDPYGSERKRVDWADPTSTGTPTDHQAFYVSVDYIATSESQSISMRYPIATDSAHIGAITNYVLEEDALKQGDVNLNGVVNLSDFDILGGNMLDSNADYDEGDLNGDGVVNMSDYRLFKDSPHRVDGYDSLAIEAAVSVPEPTTGLLLAGALAIFTSFVGSRTGR